MSYDTLLHPYDWEIAAIEDERLAAMDEENESLYHLVPDVTEEDLELWGIALTEMQATC